MCRPSTLATPTRRNKLLERRPSQEQPQMSKPAPMDNPWAEQLGTESNPLLQPLVTRKRRPRVLTPQLNGLQASTLTVDTTPTNDNSKSSSPFLRRNTPNTVARARVPSAVQTPVLNFKMRLCKRQPFRLTCSCRHLQSLLSVRLPLSHRRPSPTRQSANSVSRCENL